MTTTEATGAALDDIAEIAASLHKLVTHDTADVLPPIVGAKVLIAVTTARETLNNLHTTIEDAADTVRRARAQKAGTR